MFESVKKDLFDNFNTETKTMARNIMSADIEKGTNSDRECVRERERDNMLYFFVYLN